MIYSRACSTGLIAGFCLVGLGLVCGLVPFAVAFSVFVGFLLKNTTANL